MASLPQETIARLSAKPGVQATLILSRKDGAVIQSSGFPTEALPGGSDPSKAGEPAQSAGDRGSNWNPNGNVAEETLEPAPGNSQQIKTAEDVARAVFKYVSDSGRFADAIGGADDVQLLRLRTKKQEIVIVPDQNYLMVVCQDIARSG